MLNQLVAMFAGKKVRIIHTNPRVQNVEGICHTIHQTDNANNFDIELIDHSRFGFVPEEITAASVDGELRAIAGGRRKIELI